MGKESHTKPRSMRIPDDVWEHARACAAAEGTSVSAHIVASLKRWRPRITPPPPQPQGPAADG